MQATVRSNRKEGLEFGIRFPPTEGPESTGELARTAEDVGFKWIWGVDSPLLAGSMFDPYVDLVSCALKTEQAMIGPAVTPVFLRSPVATAAGILSLDRISRGRAVLGMGSGGSALVTMGVRNDSEFAGGARERQNLLRDQVALLRQLFAGERVSLGDRDIRVDAPRPIKIYLAASGPRMLALAGTIADGVIIQVGIWPPALKDAIARIKEGALSVGRDPSTIDLVCSTFTAMSGNRDREQDIRHVKPLASFFYNVLPHVLEEAGFDTTQRFPEQMPFPDLTHAYDWEEAMEAADSYIPDKVVESFCLVGPPDEAVEQIREIAELGIAQVFLRGPSSYHLPHDVVKTFGAHILPHFV